ILPIPKELRRLVEPPTSPSSAGSAAVKFGDELTLMGYSIDTKAGHTEVELRWNVLQKPSADYSVFVHALDGAGAVAFQGDHSLRNTTGAQTSALSVGDSIKDRFSMAPPAGRSIGSYTLRIGVWDPRMVKFLS